ncbi:MAG: hypothetical protein ACRCSL_04655 [Microbacterium sp.]
MSRGLSFGGALTHLRHGVAAMSRFNVATAIRIVIPAEHHAIFGINSTDGTA